MSGLHPAIRISQHHPSLESMMISTRALTRVAIGLTFASHVPSRCSRPTAAAADCERGRLTAAARSIREMQLRGPRSGDAGDADALRRYVGIVQPIRQTDYAETVAWLDGERDHRRLPRLGAAANDSESLRRVSPRILGVGALRRNRWCRSPPGRSWPRRLRIDARQRAPRRLRRRPPGTAPSGESAPLAARKAST